MSWHLEINLEAHLDSTTASARVAVVDQIASIPDDRRIEVVMLALRCAKRNGNHRNERCNRVVEVCSVLQGVDHRDVAKLAIREASERDVCASSIEAETDRSASGWSYAANPPNIGANDRPWLRRQVSWGAIVDGAMSCPVVPVAGNSRLADKPSSLRLSVSRHAQPQEYSAGCKECGKCSRNHDASFPHLWPEAKASGSPALLASQGYIPYQGKPQVDWA